MCLCYFCPPYDDAVVKAGRVALQDVYNVTSNILVHRRQFEIGYTISCHAFNLLVVADWKTGRLGDWEKD